MHRNRNLFISHSWSYGHAYDGLLNLLKKDFSFKFKNYSVPKESPIHGAGNDKQLYEEIQSRIRFCEVVIILAGVYATYSKWIKKEIRISKVDFKKPLLAIRPRASQKISSLVQNNADRLVGWNTNSIVNAVRELAP